MSDADPSEIGAVRDTSPISRAFLTGDPEAGRLVLVRHGQQHFPPPGTRDFAAYVDPPLSPTGRLQAEALGTFFADRPVDAVYSSGLQRARDTGAAIASPHGLTPVVVDDLREIEMFRDLPAGMSPTEAYGPAALETAREAFVATRRWDDYPGTETGDQLRARVGAAIEAILARHPAQVVVVACHGGVINAYLALVLGLDREDMFFRPAHASIHRVAYLGSRRVVETLNEMHHMMPADELLTH
jgi:probable phosphoglycerate mutase